MTTTRTYWIGTACRENVHRGIAGGFCQLGHGRQAPVKQLKPGDLIVYYSPRETMDPKSQSVQAFTSVGEVQNREPYLVQMTPEFQAYRRDVIWWPAREATVRPLIAGLSFIRDPVRWGYPFHRGAFKVRAEDFATIAEAMGVQNKL
jgi:hypothetical protein